jgi:hypothetical protein
MSADEFLFVGELHSGVAGLPVVAKRPESKGLSADNVSAALGRIIQRSDAKGTDAETRAATDAVLTVLNLSSQPQVAYLVCASVGYTTDESLLPGGPMRSLVDDFPVYPLTRTPKINGQRMGLLDEDGVIATKKFFRSRSVLRVALTFRDAEQAALSPVVARLIAQKVTEHPGFAGGFVTPQIDVPGDVQQNTVMFDVVSAQNRAAVTRRQACEALSEFGDIVRGAVVAFPVTKNA